MSGKIDPHDLIRYMEAQMGDLSAAVVLSVAAEGHIKAQFHYGPRQQAAFRRWKRIIARLGYVPKRRPRP